jgi:hypothetical protein
MRMNLKLLLKTSALFALVISLNSCYNDDYISTRDYDVVYTQKLDGFDFNQGSYGAKKVNFVVSDTVIYYDDKGRMHKIPGSSTTDITAAEAKAMINAVEDNMIHLGWNELDKNTPPTEEQVKAAVLVNITLSYNSYVGGGYYPIYPGWGYWGGYYPVWGAYYYSYETGSVYVKMIEPNPSMAGGEKGKMVWETYLSGIMSKSVNLQSILNGIHQGFDQSEEYLKR